MIHHLFVTHGYSVLSWPNLLLLYRLYCQYFYFAVVLEILKRSLYNLKNILTLCGRVIVMMFTNLTITSREDTCL